MHNTPAIPTCDTLVEGAGFASYGPRVNDGGDVRPPTGEEATQFHGVYAWCPAELVWRWMADCRTAYLAAKLAKVLAG